MLFSLAQCCKEPGENPGALVFPHPGFDDNTCAVLLVLDNKSRDIVQGVETGGAGDQGIMFGYVCNKTPELMPLALPASSSDQTEE